MSDVRVAAGAKIAVIAHCLLNQNAKPHLRARFPGIVPPVLDVLREAGFALVQLPCPEIAFAGIRRWSQVIEQFDTPAYRNHCKDLAARSIDQIEHYLRYGLFTLVMIGVEGSPSCGVHLTGSSLEWQGYPGAVELNGKYPVKEGTGLFMKEIQKEITARGLSVPPILAVGLDLYGIDLNQIAPKLKADLKNLSID
jgi:predicted secreted protein